MIALLILRNNRIVACASVVYVCACVRVCVAYPRAILMLEMETNAEQSILLSYNKHSFILVYSTVFLLYKLQQFIVSLQIILTISRKIIEDARAHDSFGKFLINFKISPYLIVEKISLKICQNKTRDRTKLISFSIRFNSLIFLSI